MNNPETPRIIHLSETDSTNRYLLRIAETEQLRSGSIVCADFQTAGRGQAGSAWESEAGKNLTFSILFRPEIASERRLFVISEIASLSVKYTLDKYLPDITVKWPNDVYYKASKIAGILIENAIMEGNISQSVIGIGINVNQTVFNSDAPNPISMAQITGQTYDLRMIMNDFQQIFAVQSERLNSACYDAIHNNYLNAMYRKVGYYQYTDEIGAFKARIYDIEPTGRLILERPDGHLSRYAFKEVAYSVKKTLK